MFFNFSDPDQARQVIEQLKISFENAATAASPAQPQFKKLSTHFNNAAGAIQSLLQNPQAADPMVMMMQVGPSVMGMKMTFQQIQEMAKTDPAVKNALQDLGRDIADRTKPFMKDMPSFPGLPDFGGGNGGGGQNDNSNPGPADNGNDQKPKGPKKPKPPSGSGDFTF